MHIHSVWVQWRIMEGSVEGLKMEYEILWINSYGFNYQLKQSDEKNYSTH